MKILAINGSYRANGFTDQVLYKLASRFTAEGAEVEQIDLRDYPINFCYNCRHCMQKPGPRPGRCAQDDPMADLVSRLEAADALILASPTNMGAVTALFKRFMERLAVYGYWPWGAPAPHLRRQGIHDKPTILVTSSAAPAILTRWFFSSCKQLKYTSRILGGHCCATLIGGLVATSPYPQVSARMERQLADAVTRVMRDKARMIAKG